LPNVTPPDRKGAQTQTPVHLPPEPAGFMATLPGWGRVSGVRLWLTEPLAHLNPNCSSSIHWMTEALAEKRAYWTWLL
jgi:hypothetical protein